MSQWQKWLNADLTRVLQGNVTASALGLLMFMSLARILPTEDFGNWVLFGALAGLLDLMRTGLVRQGLVRAVHTAKEEDEKMTFIGSSWILALAISFLLAVATLLVGVVIHFMKLEWSLDFFFWYYPALCTRHPTLSYHFMDSTCGRSLSENE